VRHTSQVPKLFDLPHAEASRLVATGAPVYLTINPVEYHGPHLSLHNDRLVSTALAEQLHERLREKHDWPFLLASDLEIGVEPCPGIGSRHTPYAIARNLVIEACRALVELGAKRVVLVTFHGSPLHNLAIEAGIQLLVEHGVRAVAPFNYVLRELLMLDDPSSYAEAFAHIADHEERAAMMADLRNDFHAGFFETSMALHLAPQSVSASYKQLPPCPPIRRDPALDLAARAARAMGRDMLARELDFAAAGKGWNSMRPFYGYTGRPHLASAQAGAVFARIFLETYGRGVEAVLEGRETSPEPILKWIGVVSAGGRLAGLEVPIDQLLRFEEAAS
jgi:creatinine amidohydrolase